MRIRLPAAALNLLRDENGIHMTFSPPDAELDELLIMAQAAMEEIQRRIENQTAQQEEEREQEDVGET